MTFFDEYNLNKYTNLKKKIVPYELELFKSPTCSYERYGDYDGSYVLPKELVEGKRCTVFSYGIGNDPEGVSFEQSLDRSSNHILMYDGSIDEVPAKITNGVFRKEYLNKYNFRLHLNRNKENLTQSHTRILKMDIEGHEYDWGSMENIWLAAENFDVFCIEAHSLIEEVPEGWVLEPQLEKAKKDRWGKIKFFDQLNRHFNLWHIHGNNHSPKYVDFPDSLELTYINDKITKNERMFHKQFPLDIDKPNYDGRPDYILDWWL